MKIGDWVTIRSKEWYDKSRNYYGNVVGHDVDFIPSMAGMCGIKLQIVSMVDKDHIRLSAGPQDKLWASWMFEDAYESGEPIVKLSEEGAHDSPRPPKGSRTGKGDRPSIES